MKEITVISGKGGTGKTTITASLAYLLENKVIADCDVDAANLNLLIKSTPVSQHEFKSGNNYRIDLEKCVQCGKCKEVCRFDAVEIDEDGQYNINHIKCEGCGFCYFTCELKAIDFTINSTGMLYQSETPLGSFVYAELNVAEENSGKLVTEVRKQAEKVAQENKAEYLLVDGPPGIACPVNAALTGTNLAVIVTEPTLSGIHDLERIIRVAEQFKITSYCIINKYDIDVNNAEKIQEVCAKFNIPVIAEIPFSTEIYKSVEKQQIFTESYPDHPISDIFKNILEKIR
ncbi:MAG: P-loop NTPase [bacterium]